MSWMRLLLTKSKMHSNPNLKRAGTFGLSMVAYWLMKSEPHVYPYEQLVKDGSTHWDGVRNYQARNLMRDEMKMGDLVLFYHSNFKPPHVVGIARVCQEVILILLLKTPIPNILMKKQLLTIQGG